ncbi:hypothetical protein [Bradyrhizobium niftali]|jgi:hypothetical protein|uniref:Lipoprotein n=1 Tax=Bradyrhizobium niftali TaxID=2560055 RepID=A0A4Y9L1H7_9BRAD|nr:hypothetical protein [Bradyrhizobium niftali]TFV36557.1 hypothetical protein E4K65_45100 [Bradyrhizobium niftali]
MRFVPLLFLLLSGCSSMWTDTALPTPEAPQETSLSDETLREGIAKAADDAHLQGPIETSSLRKTSLGPGSSFVCLREANPTAGKQSSPYSVFFEGNTYKGARLSVIREECERQAYAPTEKIDLQAAKLKGCAMPAKPCAPVRRS